MSKESYIFEIGESKEDLRKIEIRSENLLGALVEVASVLKVTGSTNSFNPEHLFIEVTCPAADTARAQAEMENVIDDSRDRARSESRLPF